MRIKINRLQTAVVLPITRLAVSYNAATDSWRSQRISGGDIIIIIARYRETARRLAYVVSLECRVIPTSFATKP